MNRFSLTLRQTLILGAALSILLPALVLGYVESTSSFKADLETRVRMPMAQYADLLTRGMGEAIWTLNQPMANELTEAVMGSPDVVSVTVLDEDQEVFARQARPAPDGAATLREERDIVYNGTPLGRVAVELSTARVRRELLRGLVKQGVVMAVQVLLSFLFVWLLFDRRILRPLRELQADASRLARGDLDQPVGWHRRDEIGGLARAMDQMRIDLAAMIARRERAEKDLQAAQKLDNLGSLAGGVAHDMNNVLAAILAIASANLEGQPAGSALHRAFDTIAKAALRGGRMVKSLLNFARQTTAEDADVDLNGVIREVVQLLERTTLAKIDLVLDLEAQPGIIRGDASALAHAFMNLCVNAVDAMPDAGRLTLQTGNGEGEVLVRVEDTGIGMTAEVLQKALDPFFTTKPVGKGTGLGLSMVYGIVKAHKGRLDLHSEPGRGTRVSLAFPISQGADPGRPDPAGALRAPEADAGPAGSVLLVDDDDFLRGPMQELLAALGHQAALAALGHQAALAASGEEALALLEGGSSRAWCCWI
jgi:signal transduction histidine kinase